VKNNDISIFFRNDDPDVFNLGDKREILYKLTDLFIEKKVPLVHAVVPKSITDKTVLYFNTVNEQNHLLEFIQHGLTHSIYNQGEFDNTRSYQQQQDDIRCGKKLMEDMFKEGLFECFSAPYGIYNNDTFKILEEENFKVVSSAIKFSSKHILFNKVGNYIKKTIFMSKRVSYHCNNLPNMKLKEISISLNIMRKDDPFEIISTEYFLEMIKNISKHTSNIGVLLHHINLKSAHLEKISSLLNELKTRDYKFAKLSEIYKKITP
jgi:predicted deacetylase